MFEKNMRISYLLDFYAEALDSHIANVMRAYYNDDLSLAEIAQGENISRQGIRHLIKKGEDRLEFFEKRFGLAKRYEELEEATRELLDVKSSLLSLGNIVDAEKIERAIGIISKGNQDVRESG